MQASQSCAILSNKALRHGLKRALIYTPSPPPLPHQHRLATSSQNNTAPCRHCGCASCQDKSFLSRFRESKQQQHQQQHLRHG
ncbi:hypothetical protein VYU27_001691 [Nannochloropsis oceanica]